MDCVCEYRWFWSETYTPGVYCNACGDDQDATHGSCSLGRVDLLLDWLFGSKKCLLFDFKCCCLTCLCCLILFVSCWCCWLTCLCCSLSDTLCAPVCCLPCYRCPASASGLSKLILNSYFPTGETVFKSAAAVHTRKRQCCRSSRRSRRPLTRSRQHLEAVLVFTLVCVGRPDER